MNLDEESLQLFQDASHNFETARYEDAYRGFRYLMQRVQNDDNYSTFLYLAYRSCISGELTNSPIRQARLITEVGYASLTIAAKYLLKKLDADPSVSEKVRYLEELHKVLALMGEHEKKAKVILKLVETYLSLSREHDVPTEEKLSYLERVLELLKDYEDYDDTIQIINELADAYYEMAETKRNLDHPEYEIQYNYHKSMECYERINQQGKVREVRERMEID